MAAIEQHLCSCNHANTLHPPYGKGACRGVDSYDCRCECPSFEHSQECREIDEGRF